MDLRAPLQLQSMIKSMTDVVLPAIDSNNQMAQEQAQLILGMMHLLAARLPLQFDYDIDELKRNLELSRELIDTADGGQQTTTERDALAIQATNGADVLNRAQATPAELEAASLAMRSQISALVDALWLDGEASCRRPASKAVLRASKEQILRERAWFAPQGWDADMSAYPSIETLIDHTESGDETKT